jgi:hypothetical protein
LRPFPFRIVTPGRSGIRSDRSILSSSLCRTLVVASVRRRASSSTSRTWRRIREKSSGGIIGHSLSSLGGRSTSGTGFRSARPCFTAHLKKLDNPLSRRFCVEPAHSLFDSMMASTSLEVTSRGEGRPRVANAVAQKRRLRS